MLFNLSQLVSSQRMFLNGFFVSSSSGYIVGTKVLNKRGSTDTRAFHSHLNLSFNTSFKSSMNFSQSESEINQSWKTHVHSCAQSLIISESDLVPFGLDA